ncbi:tRNA-dihydrouridine synthase [Thermosporothrix hazakensis]|jgi:tRNA-dihydrouridine synthase|uniref:tRNA-dihydrouridine synthase n=2 Tax=Thermosporothrix TaxID=768650 RepID=A0A326URG2_THEHA|nr:tRNA-dihydrouridine synthase [Thermosporothrix hazakensis]PZW33007.1 tRNA-dihydrouridine synthase [Thermosporothrix hazakensis]BBH90989.1 tRNA-dihydrouridine synthase [Thermosporothrix sp. COM3]GCE49039.1 tRNA-dihydrouridine synthase [Thermosporothrix hazakensis]
MKLQSFWNTLQRPIVALAPMDGVTDAPCRTMHGLYGKPDIVLTEFTNVEGLWRGSDRIFRDFLYTPAERPVVAQIFGCRPEYFYKAAHVVCELGFDGVDINMGCPAKSVANKGGGAALIRMPDTAKAIIRATQEGVRDWANGQTLEDLEMDPERIKRIRQMNEERVHIWGDTARIERRLIPVSVKTRLGYDSIVIKDWIKELLEMDLANISLHGRTLVQHYKGFANWDAIAEAAEIVHASKTGTLIMGNGDIHNLYEAARRIRETGVDGVLIGRATFGNPWLFQTKEQMKAVLNSGLEPTPENIPEVMPTREERLLMALEHARVHAKIKGESHFVELRKHMGWYLGHFPGAKKVRNELVCINCLADVERIILQALEQPDAAEEESFVAPTLEEEVHDPELDMSCSL